MPPSILHRIAGDVLAAAAVGWATTGAAPIGGETWIAVEGPQLVAPGEVGEGPAKGVPTGHR